VPDPTWSNARFRFSRPAKLCTFSVGAVELGTPYCAVQLFIYDINSMCVCVCVGVGVSVSVSVSLCVDILYVSGICVSAQDECVAKYGRSGNHTKKRAKLLKEKEGAPEPQP